MSDESLEYRAVFDGFFPPDPDPMEPDDVRQPRVPWWTAPADEIPVLHPVSQTIAVTPHVAIALIGTHVYSDGVEFRVERRLRRGDLRYREWQELNNVFIAYGHDGVPNNGRLRYGVRLSDGERVVDGSAFLRGNDPSTPPEVHVLTRGGGGGSGDTHAYSASDELWLWPLPPAGPLEVVVQWPAMDIPETSVSLDATPFAGLAQHAAAPLWPDQAR
jgi:hypothetical protein